MTFSLSPAVLWREFDSTLTTAAVAISSAGFGGGFQWGPVLVPTLIETENQLVQRFGKPNDDTAISFFTAANFLAYARNINIVRNVGEGAKNSGSNVTVESFVGTGSEDEFDLDGTFAEAPATGVYSVYVDDVFMVEGTDYTFEFNAGTVTLTFLTAPVLNAVIEVLENSKVIFNEDSFMNASDLTGDFYGKYPGTMANGLKIIAVDATSWAALGDTDKALFDGAPVGEEIHVAIIDAQGRFERIQNQVLEIYQFLSKTPGSKAIDGTSNYFKQVINDRSAYIWSTGLLNDVVDGVVVLDGGKDDNVLTDGQKIEAFSMFEDPDTIDVGIIPLGEASDQVVESVLSLAQNRADTVACVSPAMSDVVNNRGSEVADVVTFRTGLPSTSYGFMDDNWKYQYDRYNDVYRWIPCNGDTAGLMARVDSTNAPWFSPAGLNRGQIKNVVKLAWNPTKAQRDTLYKNNVNSIVSFQGQGTVLWGDKTLLARPSAFDRINVRRLFIYLEKSIATASKYILFDFNDEFTRTTFVNMVEPFLREVQGRRGIVRFRVVANEENNTPQIIDTNSFVGSIFIDPSRSINNIMLNFMATSSGASFDEIEIPA